MYLKRSALLSSAILLSSCVVYTQDLINGAKGDTSGDGDSSGGSEDGASGGKGSGGRTSGGGGTGGDPDDGSGGEEMPMGGTDPGTGGNDDSGGNSGDSGGSASGGSAGSGGTGSGGGPVCATSGSSCLIDDFEHAGSASYFNSPFSGKWDRYGEDDPSTAWTATTVGAMVAEAADDLGNISLRIGATGLSDWGVGVFVTLKGGSALDLSGAEGISFRVRSANTESTIQVALADENSHQPICDTLNAGADCDKHMRSLSAPTKVISAAWTTLKLDFDSFGDPGEGAAPRASDLNLAKVHAIHLQVDTVGTVADFYIDDLTMY